MPPSAVPRPSPVAGDDTGLEGGGGGGSYLAPIFDDRSLVTGAASNGAYASLYLVQPIPTPGAFALMGTSALAVAAVARSRRRTA